MDLTSPAASQGGSASSSLVAPATFDITVTDGYNGTYSSYYTISGDDRYGEISGNDVPVRMYTGDTVVFDTSALSGSHPLYIRVSDGGASVSNPGYRRRNYKYFLDTITTGTYYYQCSAHPGMIGIIYVEDPVNAEPTIDVKNTNIEGEWDYYGSDSEQLNWELVHPSQDITMHKIIYLSICLHILIVQVISLQFQIPQIIQIQYQ